MKTPEPDPALAISDEGFLRCLVQQTMAPPPVCRVCEATPLRTLDERDYGLCDTCWGSVEDDPRQMSREDYLLRQRLRYWSPAQVDRLIADVLAEGEEPTVPVPDRQTFSLIGLGCLLFGLAAWWIIR